MEKGFFLPAMKKRKTSIAGQGQPKHLVICFSPLTWTADPMYYSFESFPISKLTHGGNYLKQNLSDDCPSFPAIREKPEGVFVWCDNENPSDSHNPRHWGMSFLHIGGGQVYAAGGIEKDDTDDNCFTVATLNKEFRCISLSTPLESSTVECRRSMQINTYTPLMVEMGGLIYVLSAPPDLLSNHTESTGFEVYNPLTDAWTTLKTPNFLDEPHDTVPRGVSRYSYVVIRNKLCVSTLRYSAIFDTETKEWGPCNLFSECKLNGRTMCSLSLSYGGDFSPPFPFEEKAIYRNNIILGLRYLYGKLDLFAFKVTDDEEKAIQMPLHFDDMPKGIGCVDIVDLGDDCFALMTEVVRPGYEYLIVTFKVVSKMMKNEEGEGEVEGLVCELMDITSCGAALDSRMPWGDPIYWFTM